LSSPSSPPASCKETGGNLITAYKADIASKKISLDEKQLAVINSLQSLQDKILKRESPSVFKKIFSHFSFYQKNISLQGIYLWGTVGAGKTYLMDLFYQNLSIKNKLRLHFHHFMKEVHDNLALLQGKPDPLRIIARHFSMRTKLLCFDEFVVEDIADAMILGRLLTFLLERNVILIATSNIPPDRLYWEGLQRELFLPAIEAIKANCQIIQLANLQDYRWRSLQQGGIYFTPLDEKAEQNMQQCFELYAHGSGQTGIPLIIEQRPIATRRIGKSVIWFDFKALCSPPRGQRDYLAISNQFQIVLISNVPSIAPDDETTISYWIELIDIFYDAHITLILSAQTPLKDIYPSGTRQFAFERTLSRLIEMQSVEYLQKNHC
jgi:cell division protein ZapE